MITTIIKDQVEKITKKNYPYIGKSNKTSRIVLFIARGVCRVSRSYKWIDYLPLMGKLGKGKARG